MAASALRLPCDKVFQTGAAHGLTPSHPSSVDSLRSAVLAAARALGRTAASIFGILRRTAEAGSSEILIVAAQDEFVSPTESFDVEPLEP